MLKRVFLIAVLAGLALAQEGHPLTGSWHGDWGTSPTQRNHITMSMQWDTKNIVGKINPGPNSIPLKVATLDPSKWTVHFEADGKDQGGVIKVAAGKSLSDADLLRLNWFVQGVDGSLPK